MVHPWFQGGMPVGNEKEKFNAASIKKVAVLLLCVITILLISCTRMQPKPIDATPPILMNATLSTDGSRITLRFDIPMKPPSDAQKICFTVLADTVQQVIRKLQMNPANLREFFLDLQTPLAHGQTVTVGYTQGTIRSQGGGFLLSFTERNVQNNVPLGAPQYVRSQTNEAGNQIHIIFDRAMADPTGTQAQFSVVTKSPASSRGVLTVSSVSRSPTDLEELVLTVSPLIQNGETIELGYTRGTVQSSEGAYLESFSGKVVTNQVPGDAPILVSATLTEHGTQVIAAFDKPMKEPTPLQRSEFTVRADGITQTIVSLSRQPGNENAFIFTLQTPISFEKQVTLSYLKGTVQAQNDEYLGSFDDRLVTNEVPPGTPQYVRSQTNETGNQIHVFFDRAMADPTGTQAQFSVVTNSPASSRGVLTVSSVSRSTTDLEEFILTVSPVVQNGETIELGYTRGTVQSNEGAYLESFSGKVVTNQVPGDAPILLSATLTEHGTQVIATFDKPMKEPVSGQLSQFSVRVDGLARALQSLGRNPANEAQYLLELSSPASYGEQVTLTYIKGTIQAQNNEYLGSFVDRLVTNEVPPGAPQYVRSQTNETGNEIHVFFDRAMADPTGTQAQFSVVTNSPASSRGVLTVSSVSRSTTDLEEFILSVSPVAQNGETIELGYTRGSVQSNEGAYLESFSGKVVTNQVPGDSPVLVSATLTEHGTQVIATFDKTMKEPTLLQRSEFAVRADGITQTIVSLSRQIGNESAFVLALQTPISFDKQVTLTYLKGTVQAQNEAFLSSFVDAIVTNLSQTPVRLTYPAQDQTDVGINLTLQWEGVTGAAGYRILFGDSPGSLIQQNVELVTDTWYTLREMLTLSTGYYWKIEAVAANGATVTSETRGFTTSDVLKPLPVSLWRNSAVIGQYETVGEAVAFAFHGDTIAIERGSTVVEPDTVYIPYGLTVTASPAFTETDRATLTGGGEYGVLFFGKLEWFLFPTIARDTFGNLEAFKRSDLPKVRSGEYAYGARNLNIVGSDGITGITVTNPPVIPSPQKDGARAVGIPAYLYHIDISGCRNLIFSTISAFFSSVYAENLYLHHNDGGIGVAFGELLLTDSRITDNGIESENLGVGAVSALLSTVSIVRSTLSRNYADIEGAGFCAEMSQFAIDSCEIEENITPSFGSGICIVESRGTIIDSTINRNESEEEGGGLYVATSVVNIINSEFSENTALTSGSGLFLMGVEATLSSLTVDQNECAEKGGGIYCEHATLSVLDTVLSGNKASLGGGFYGFSATVTIHEGSIITGNETNKTGILDSLGGGIYLSGSSVLIEDATLTSNTCRSNDFVRGGGVYAEDSELVIRRAEIKENALESLGGYGAGVYCTSSGLAVENSLIAANTNLGCTDEAYGGGVGISNSDAWISDTSITGNSARTAGGGLYADDAGLNLTRCVISENQLNETDAIVGDADGGGVYAVDTDATITESQISENRLYGEFGDGAGLFSESSDITIEDSTITENEANAASSNGGGILAHISSEIILFSTLIASNTATEEGGGIWIQMGSVLDTARDPGNVSIAFNSAGTAGGGIYFQGTELYTNVSNPWNSGTPFSRSDDFFVLLGDGSIQDTWDENSKGTLVRGNTAPANAQIDWSN